MGGEIDFFKFHSLAFQEALGPDTIRTYLGGIDFYDCHDIYPFRQSYVEGFYHK